MLIVCYWKQLSIKRLSQINRYSQILYYYVGIDKDEIDVHIQIKSSKIQYEMRKVR